jgi:hypothetical protein
MLGHRSETGLQYAGLLRTGEYLQRSSLLKTASPFRDVPQCRGRGAVVFGETKASRQGWAVGARLRSARR